MKKLKKRLTAAAAAAIVMASAGITASAEHETPESTEEVRIYCDNTFYWLGDSTCVGTSKGTHDYSCTVTFYAYRHTKTCSSCHVILGEGPAYNCTQIHTCGNIIRDCKSLKRG